MCFGLEGNFVLIRKFVFLFVKWEVLGEVMRKVICCFNLLLVDKFKRFGREFDKY